MEIKVNVPMNDYVVPTEVRAEVVQGICEAFLSEKLFDNVFHPYSDGSYRCKTLYIIKHSNSDRFYGFGTNRDEVKVRFNGEEMKAAFQALRKAGYHMFKVYMYGSWMGYRCSKKPFLDGGYEVSEFTDFID